MKIVNVQGISKTGKTTTVSAIIKELKRRGYTVGSVKEIHFESFTVETEGSNTHIHKKSGAEPVTARGLYETDIMFEHRIDIDRLLDIYTQDYVVIEGRCEANCPTIVTGRNTDEVDEEINPLTIAISGVISNEIKEYRGFEVIDARENIERLVDIIEEKTPDRMPNFSEDCCKACGYGCRGLTERIIDGRGSRSECILGAEGVSVTINGKELPMVPFVKSIVRSVSTSVIKELDGYQPDSEIIIKIK